MQDDTRARRRGLLALIGAGVAAPAAQAITVEGDRAGLPGRTETEAEKRAPRYRETDHVRAFYATNRT